MTTSVLIPSLTSLYPPTSHNQTSWSDQRASGGTVQPVMTPAIYTVSPLFWPSWPQRHHRTLSYPWQNPDNTVSAVFSESVQFSNPIKNGNEVNLAGNEVSLATVGETLYNVRVNSLS